MNTYELAQNERTYQLRENAGGQTHSGPMQERPVSTTRILEQYARLIEQERLELAMSAAKSPKPSD